METSRVLRIENLADHRPYVGGAKEVEARAFRHVFDEFDIGEVTFVVPQTMRLHIGQTVKVTIEILVNEEVPQ